ncbi:hypothetical protein AGABI2DRAFT_119761 [Agaricus bisporus var. bisporus H97]|uniref:hypothetical protein n=1 Tax=Agaricus bisporus var. bisporus (strain H97 / ATCC MYA-4626 / FGSC 10389) TaxID=936046 RepID=UPI00029F4FDC|nr:hypothetical protein AGABI2DRAFT_119761 [Agaricus bisporus var. bisporus H97]EKV46108.1 hypothetical protein AGABI2DRAFT_119761 [Agaricus bisporus var. bisporus H97]
MSSDLNNSPTDISVTGTASLPATHRTTCNEETYVHQAAVKLVGFLSQGIEEKLPITKLDIDPANSPELENIKEETRLLPEDTFRVFINLFRLLNSHRLELTRLRIKANNNEPIPNNIFETFESTLINDGNAILEEHHQIISEHISSLDESCNKLNRKILMVFGKSENTKQWLKLVDAVRVDKMPSLSDIKTGPWMAPIGWVGNVVANIAACEASRKLDGKSKELEILERALREEMSVAVKTEQKLKMYLKSNESASTSWISTCRKSYDSESLEEYTGDVEVVIMREINLVDQRLSQLIAPIKEYIVLKNEYYARGITVIREVDCFCDVVPKIFQDIKRIFEAKEIIKRRHRAKFEKTVYDLGLVIFSYLGLMRDAFDPEKQKEFLAVSTQNFVEGTKLKVHEIGKIIDTQSSGWRSKKAEKKRIEGDRCYENMSWRQRPLVKPNEVQTILNRVQRATDTIRRLAITSGAGKIMESIEEKDDIRAHVAFDASHESLKRLRRVLRENVNADLERLNKLRN